MIDDLLNWASRTPQRIGDRGLQRLHRIDTSVFDAPPPDKGHRTRGRLSPSAATVGWLPIRGCGDGRREPGTATAVRRHIGTCNFGKPWTHCHRCGAGHVTAHRMS
jgi:hypothetical protein